MGDALSLPTNLGHSAVKTLTREAQNDFRTVVGHKEIFVWSNLKEILVWSNLVSEWSKYQIGKKVNKSMCDFLFVNVTVFLQRQNVGFTGEDLVIFPRIRASMAGQHDQRVKFFASQVTILTRHYSCYQLTFHYFEPCSQDSYHLYKYCRQCRVFLTRNNP